MAEQTPATDPRQVEYLPLDDLLGDPRNPKDHDEDTIQASVGRFGVLDLIVRDGRTGYIVSGHGRKKALTAMRDAGETAPEGVTVDENGEWLVPVVTGWSSRSDTEAHAALISLNRTTELGGWVDDELLSLLDELSETEAGFVGVGFDESAIDDLRRYLDSHEIATSWTADEEDGSGSGEGDGDEIGSISLRENQQVINVVIPEDRREDFYRVLAGLDWIIDARDSRGA